MKGALGIDKITLSHSLMLAEPSINRANSSPSRALAVRMKISLDKSGRDNKTVSYTHLRAHET